MQATFDDGQTAVDLLQFLNIASIPRFLKEPMAITDISVWASKIVFLNFALGPELKQLHCDVANLWLPKALRASADPQSFVGISDGQRQSISSTAIPLATTNICLISPWVISKSLDSA
jgi:hypothetical protein